MGEILVGTGRMLDGEAYLLAQGAGLHVIRSPKEKAPLPTFNPHHVQLKLLALSTFPVPL